VGKKVLDEYVWRLDLVVFSGDDQCRHGDPVSAGGDVLGDALHRPVQPGGVVRAGGAVGKYLRGKVVWELLVSEHVVAGEPDGLRVVVSMGDLLPVLAGDVLGRHRGGGSDQNQPSEGKCAAAGDDLRDLATHRVSDQHDLAQVELLEDGFYIVGELLQTVRAAEPGRLTPASLGERDGFPFGQRVDDRVPRLRRSSKVVQEQEGRSRSGATVHGHAPAAHVNPGFGT
jgi:hypothetical protein